MTTGTLGRLLVAVLIPVFGLGGSGLCAAIELCGDSPVESSTLAAAEGGCHAARPDARDGNLQVTGTDVSDACCWSPSERLEAKVERRQGESPRPAAFGAFEGGAVRRVATHDFSRFGERSLPPLWLPAFTLNASLRL